MQYEDGNLSPLQAFFRNKWVRIILVIDVLIIIAIIAVLIINATRVSTINLDITPLDATISINGDTNYHSGVYSMTPGTYEVVISHDGLNSKTFTIDLAPHYVSTVSTFLSGEDNNYDFYEQKENYPSLQKLIEIASSGHNTTTDHDPSAEEFISDFKHILSISDVLPIKDYVYANSTVNASTAGFAIHEGRDGCKLTACLLVNYYGSGYEDAVKAKITEAGFNPDDYQIIYERYN